MDKLAALESLAQHFSVYCSYILPILAIWLLVRCFRSLLRAKYEPELWAYLETAEGETAAIRSWECIIGRSRSCDVTIRRDSVSRTHACLIRDDDGDWMLYDLQSTGGSGVGTYKDKGDGLPVEDGDTIRIADIRMTFHDLNEEQRSIIDAQRSEPGRFVSPGLTLMILTLFQAVITLEYTLTCDPDYVLLICLAFAAIAVIQWLYYFTMRIIDRSGFEIETIAFFLSTLGTAVAISSDPDGIFKQLMLFIAAILVFLFTGWWLRDLGRVTKLRWTVAIGALLLLGINIVAGDTNYGATNWLSFGGITLQPSEFVKIAYVYVGAAALDRLFRGRNLFMFIAFSAVCVGSLAIMGDFGTAVVFFITFLIISFMRSGSFATVILAVSSAVIAGMLVLTAKPYIAQRFATWGHVWDDPYGAGWQQTRALTAAADGGLFGVGAGNGWLHTIFAANEDMAFCLMCEEYGLIVAVCAIVAIVVLALFAVRSASQGRSSYYVIAACAASAIMLVQLSLNVFGSVDLLPFTGVTFPFVSTGGSSLISCWALLAFFKAVDTRQGASFSVSLHSRIRYQEDEE